MKDFATIEKLNSEQDSFEVTLNQNSSVYKGHFPNQPVAPGVLLMKTVTDCLEMIYKKKLNLKSSRNLKFLVPVTPDRIDSYTIELKHSEENGIVKVKSVAKDQDTILFKFDGNYSFA